MVSSKPPRTPTRQQSTKPSPVPGHDVDTPRHLMGALNNTADKLRAKKAEDTRRAEVTFENEQDYRKSLNTVLHTKEGMEVFKRLLQFTRLFDPPTSQDSIKMIEERGMARLYLKMVRPYVEPTTRAELENL